jgi:hypothetical protein
MANRITKAQRFEDIKAMLTNAEIPNGSTIDEALEAIDHELELISKKSTSGTRKPTATQIENENHKANIMAYLGTISAEEGVTATDVLRSVESVKDYQISKVASLLTQLVSSGKVTRNVVKGRPYFKLA